MAALNFTREIKREIVRRGIENACCRMAALSAFLRVTGSVLRSGQRVGFEFVTECERTAEFVIGMLEDLFGAELKVVRLMKGPDGNPVEMEFHDGADV